MVCGLYFIVRQTRKNASVTATGGATTKSKITIFAAAFLCVLATLFGSTVVVGAFADSGLTSPEKITAKVYPSTGKIEVDNGYISNQTGYDMSIVSASSLTDESSASVAGIDTMDLKITPLATSATGDLYNAKVGTEDFVPTFTAAFKEGTTTQLQYTLTKGDVNLNDLIGKQIVTSFDAQIHEYTLNFKVADGQTG